MMEAKRFESYHKHGCNFRGKLAVVNYYDDMQKDLRFGEFGANLTYKYIDKAKALVREHYGEPKRVLLSIPDYVVELV